MSEKEIPIKKAIPIIFVTLVLSLIILDGSIITVANAVPNYWVSGNLNTVSVDVTSSWKKIDNYLTFTKELGASSVIEVVLASRATGGTFSGTNGVEFEVRIDDTASNIANRGAITTTGTTDFITINAIFTNLPAGTHTVSVWASTVSFGSSTGVILDPGGWGGRIIVKEVLYSPTSQTSALSASLLSPGNGATVTSSPILLAANVASGGSPIQGATVSFYVDGNLVGSSTSDTNGYSSFSWSGSSGYHNWYATASMSSYTSATSSTWSFTYSPTSVLSVVLTAPANGYISVFPSASVTLSASVTSGGNPIQGATVSFYVDGNLVGSSTSSSTGSASITWMQTYGIHNWYATASMSGYTPATSSTWTFTRA